MLGSQVACPKCNHTINRLNPRSIYFACTNCKNFVQLNDASFSIPYSVPNAPLGYWLDLGDTFSTEKGEYTLTGKIVKHEGTPKEQWVEYCFVNAQNEHLFLAEYNGHWNVIEEVKPFDFLERNNASFRFNPNQKNVRIDEDDYQLWHNYKIQIGYIEGEFLFNPYEDDKNRAYEYIYKDQLRIVEVNNNVVTNCYKAQYYFPNQIQKGLGRRVDMPPQIGFGGNQPFAGGWDVGGFRILSFIALMLMFLFTAYLKNINRPVNIAHYTITANLDSTSTKYKAFISPNFHLPYFYNLVEVRLYCGELSNDWVAAEMALVNNQTDDIRYFASETEYYSGISEGTSWSEGALSTSGVVENLTKGNYHIEIEPIQALTTQQSKTINIELSAYQGSWYLFFAFAGAFALLHLVLWMAEDYFEWQKTGLSTISWSGEESN